MILSETDFWIVIVQGPGHVGISPLFDNPEAAKAKAAADRKSLPDMTAEVHRVRLIAQERVE